MHCTVHFFNAVKLNQPLVILETTCGMRELECGLQTTTVDVTVWHRRILRVLFTV